MKYAVQHKNGNWVSKYYTCTSNSKPAKFDTKEDAIKFISDDSKDKNWEAYYAIVELEESKKASEDKGLKENYEYNDAGERIDVGDYVKVVKGRKLPIGTIAKVKGFYTTGYGGWDYQRSGEHHPIEGSQNITTWVYLDNNQKTNINNLTKATKEEIEDATVLVLPAQTPEPEEGDILRFTATVERKEGPNYDTYKFTTADGQIYWAFLKYTVIDCKKGTFEAEVKEVQKRFSKTQIRIYNIDIISCDE